MLTHLKVEPIRGFVQAAEIIASAASAIRPPKRMSVSEWAAAHRQLRNAGAYSGPWRNETTPYLVEPMDRCLSRAIEKVVVVGPSQFGKTDLGLNVIGHAIDCAPRDILAVQYSRDMAIEFFQTRVERKLIAAAPSLAAKLGADRSDDKTMSKRFRNGMALTAAWPVSGQLAGRPVPVVWLDERDRMPDDIDGEGDPVELAEARTTTFGRNALVLVTSSPTEADASAIVALYATGDRNLWHWPCLDCGEYWTPGFDADRKPTQAHLWWPKDAAPDAIRDAARLACPHCGALTEDARKFDMNARGLWLPAGMEISADGRLSGTRPASRTASYWFCGLASPFMSIGKIAEKLAIAEAEYAKTGDETKIRAVTNTGLGFPYKPRAARHEKSIEVDELVGRCEPYPLKSVPPAACFLTAAVDVQATSFEVLVRAWGPRLESWVVDRFSIFEVDGRKVDPATRPKDWNLIEDHVLARTYPVSGAAELSLPILRTAVDSGGAPGVTPNAYNFWRRARRRFGQRLMLTKGASMKSAPRVNRAFPDTRRRDRKAGARGEVPVWFFNTNALKDELDAQLRSEDLLGPRVHFSQGLLEDAPPHPFFEQLTAEARGRDGSWEKVKPRNEALDLMVMCHVGALALKADRIDWDKPDTVPPFARPADSNPLAARAAGETKPPEQTNTRRRPAVSRRTGGFVNRWRRT